MNLRSSPLDTAALKLMVYHPTRVTWFYLLAAAVLAALVALANPAYNGAIGTAGQFGSGGIDGNAGGGSFLGGGGLFTGGDLFGRGNLFGSGNGSGASGIFSVISGGINAGSPGQDWQEQQ